MNIFSNSFKDNSQMSKKYTAWGSNITPHLKWSNVPKDAKSLALLIIDPDAKPVCGYSYVHWIVKNISLKETEIPEGGKIIGEQIEHHAGSKNYFGPRPPKNTGQHHYQFMIYALKVEKMLAKTLDEFLIEVEKEKIQSATTVGIYEFGMP